MPNAYISTLIGVPHVEQQNSVEFQIRAKQEARYRTTIRLSPELAERPKFSMIREGIQPINLIQVSPMRPITLGPISMLPEYVRKPTERFLAINHAASMIHMHQADVQLLSDTNSVMRILLTDLIDFGWTASDLFGDFPYSRPRGLVYLLGGRKIVRLDHKEAELDDGKVFPKAALAA